MRRLPQTKPANDPGFVYVLRRGDAYKIGFSRRGLARRIRDTGADLVLAIPVTQRPSVLEYALNRRFAGKRLPPQGDQPGDKREWFALEPADLEWLRGFADTISSTPENTPESPRTTTYCAQLRSV